MYVALRMNDKVNNMSGPGWVAAVGYTENYEEVLIIGQENGSEGGGEECKEKSMLQLKTLLVNTGQKVNHDLQRQSVSGLDERKKQADVEKKNMPKTEVNINFIRDHPLS